MGEVAYQPLRRESVRVVGRYAIFDELASGGMATVYLGRLMGSGGFARTVAIKSLHPQFAKDPEFVSMFLDEARLAARIRHPNVVPTLDVVASKGEVFLVMEYVQGETLSRLTRYLKALGQRAPLSITVRIMTDVLHGLHAAHEACDERGVALEIVHRDVSPQNVLVGVDGVGRLLDFGVAKAAGRAHTTREGQIKGKLSYMAPEQLTNAGVSRQTDVYAASVVLWEALTGERLFTGQSEIDLVAQVIKRNIRAPSEVVHDIPPALEAVVMKGLAARPQDRFTTAREMCNALGKCGVPEAPSITIGEWVEHLAADVLAERSAKVSAIESHHELSSGGILSPSTRPPDDPPTANVLPPDSPTRLGEEQSRGGPRQAGLALYEPRSEVQAIPVTTGMLRRQTQLRVWSAAGALVLIVAGGTLAIDHCVSPGLASSPAGAKAAGAPGATVAASSQGPGPQAASAASAQSSSLPPVVSIDTLPLAASAPAASEPSPPTARPMGVFPASSRPAVVVAPGRPAIRKPTNNVFDSRE